MIHYEGRLAIPADYHSELDIRDTEIAIKRIKDQFETQLADTLNLTRVSAPLYVRPETGLNDNLNGIERPVSFEIREIKSRVEVVHSLAKWKRMALARYGFYQNEGLYTDMNAIRRDEDLDNVHSVYVDQWDWELIISHEDRTRGTLKKIVREIYHCLRRTENHVARDYPCLKKKLPDDIYFITTQDLEDRFPDLKPHQREDKICKEKKAVFIMQIGDRLSSGNAHDGRAPDYDDWKLNGDLLLWFPVLERALEISSMGIRVDQSSLLAQIEKTGCSERLELDFHKRILAGTLPFTIGGGIGQSRLCQYYLDKAHIGEVQASVWPDWMVEKCSQHKMYLL